MEERLIGIDLGGTYIKALLTNSKGDVLEEASTPTNDISGVDNSAQWKASVKRLIAELEVKNGGVVRCIGVSSPGTVNFENQYVLSNGTKLLGVEDFSWADYLDRKIYVLNDAHAALYAESKLGIGKGVKNIVMITLGTGVGGAILIEGNLLQGKMGRAGHIGHTSVTKDPFLGIANTPGSIESEIGECSLARRTYGKFKSTKDLLEAHARGNGFATWVWLNSVQALARSITSSINILSPELIVIGGGVAKSGDTLMLPLLDFLDIYEWRPKGYKTPIKFAQMGNHAGAIGAALFSDEKFASSR